MKIKFATLINLNVCLSCRVRDELLEINGVLVVGKSVEEVRHLLFWTPRRKPVTVVTMVPPRDVTASLSN